MTCSSICSAGTADVVGGVVIYLACRLHCWHVGYIVGRGIRVVEWDVSESPSGPTGDLMSLKLRALTPDGIRIAIAKEYGLSNYREVSHKGSMQAQTVMSLSHLIHNGFVHISGLLLHADLVACEITWLAGESLQRALPTMQASFVRQEAASTPAMVSQHCVASTLLYMCTVYDSVVKAQQMCCAVQPCLVMSVLVKQSAQICTFSAQYCGQCKSH